MNLDLGYTRKIISYCVSQGLSIYQIAYILATVYWETARTMKPVKEAFWKDEAWRKKNLRYYPWYGRGFVQLTWESNYEKASFALKKDFLSNPDKVMDPDVATQILVEGMVGGWFTGKPLKNYIEGDNVDYFKARKVVNGMDKASEIAALAESYEEALGETPKVTPKKKQQSPIVAIIVLVVGAIVALVTGVFQ